MPTEQLYYVQDTRQYVGNCALWWCPDGNGYTTQIDEAGLYTRERVMTMRDTDRPWPKDLVDAYTVTHVRLDTLKNRTGFGLHCGPLKPEEFLLLLENEMSKAKQFSAMEKFRY